MAVWDGIVNVQGLGALAALSRRIRGSEPLRCPANYREPTDHPKFRHLSMQNIPGVHLVVTITLLEYRGEAWVRGEWRSMIMWVLYARFAFSSASDVSYIYAFSITIHIDPCTVALDREPWAKGRLVGAG